MPPPPSHLLRRLAVPVLGALLFGSALRLGGDTLLGIGLEALDTSQRMLGYALGVGEVVFLAILVQRLIQLVVLEGVVARAMGAPVPGLLTQLSALTVYLTATAAVFGLVFHQDLTVLWAASGLAGLVFGMALKDMILDAFTGLAINLDRPFRIGDVIQLHRAGDQVIEGNVLEISWRTTRIGDWFGNVVIVPNSKLASSTITNFSRPAPRSRLPIQVTLDATVPTERALRILEAAAVEGSAPYAQPDTPPPRVWAKALSPAGVDYVVNIFPALDHQLAARTAVIGRLLHHLAEAGLRPSWPKQERAETAPGDSAPTAQLIRQFGTCDLLRDLDPEDLRLLAEGARCRLAAADALLVQAGEAATAILVLVEGLLVAEPPRPAGGKPARDPVPLGPGSLIGAAALLTGDGYPETVRCRTASLVAEIDQALMRRLLTRRPEAAALLGRRLAAQQVRDARGRLQFGEAELAGDILSAIRRTFADLRLP